MSSSFAIPLTEPTPPTYQEERIELFCQQDGSDKVYHCQLTQCEAGWTFAVERGPRLGTRKFENKLQNVPYEAAKKLFDSTVREKRKPPHNYSIGNTPLIGSRHAAPLASQVVASQVAPDILFRPELLTRIDETEAERFAKNDRYWFQTKEDGENLTVRVNGSHIFGYDKNGDAEPLAPWLEASFRRLCVPTIDKLLVCGEILKSRRRFIAWEILECCAPADPLLQAHFDLRPQRYEDRFEFLQAFLPTDDALVAAVTTARTTEEKLALLADRTREGVCVKDTRAPFRPGRNGQHMKFKFEQTASFVVGPKFGDKEHDGKRSVALYVLDPAARWHSDWQPQIQFTGFRFVACVKVPECYPLPGIGEIVDVRYLYAYPEGGIAQPAYFGKTRTDVRTEDCIAVQLKYKA